MVGNLTKKKKKCQMPGGQPGGGGMGILGFDSYINNVMCTNDYVILVKIHYNVNKWH